MKNKILLLFIMVILIIGVVVFLVGSGNDIKVVEPKQYSSMEDLLMKKLGGSFAEILKNPESNIKLILTESELNELLYYKLGNTFSRKDSKISINGYIASIKDERILITIDGRVLDRIPVKCTFYLNPEIEKNMLSFYVEKVRLGRLTLPARTVLKMLEGTGSQSYHIDAQSRKITIVDNLPKQFEFEELKVEGDKLLLEVSLNVTSVRDLADILGVLFPEGLESLLKNK